ncbi:PD-(D/E)XK nuclease-like domain-containing protein, partial [Methylicorpusculum sp.]|uniref:PD-(D/E)XK nuclease-like domain-containing protein n=1 Tax=Methylicorpusculum sp. TaxID=2713644 RepID=UPI002ABB6898
MTINLMPLQYVSSVPQMQGAGPVIYSADALSNAAYHKDQSSVSSSQLKLLLRSPLHFQQGLNEAHEETPAMRIGTAIHTALLEPDQFRR